MIPAREKLLIVGSFPDARSEIFGGIATSCAQLINSRISDEYEVLTFDSTTLCIPPPGLVVRASHALPRIYRFCRIVFRERPEKLLVFSSAGSSYLEKALMCVYAGLLGTTVVLSLRSGALMSQLDKSTLFLKFACWTSKYVDGFLCQGDIWKKYIVAKMGVPARKCHIIENWTASDELLEMGAGRDYHSSKRVNILFMGWLEGSKGVLDLVEAFVTLLDDHPTCQLWLAGVGSVSSRVQKMIEDGDLKESIHLLGWVQGDAKLRLLSEGDIFCLPSYSEGLPNSMVEALASGLPVVVTPVGMIPGMISNQENGLIVPVGNSIELSKALVSLIDNPSLRSKIGRNGSRYAEANLGIDSASRQILEMLSTP